MVEANMRQLGIRNFSMYARKMLCDGYLIKRDFSYLKSTARELGRIAQSLNQIARRANSTQNIYNEDLQDINSGYRQAKMQIATVITKLVNEEKFYKSGSDRSEQTTLYETGDSDGRRQD